MIKVFFSLGYCICMLMLSIVETIQYTVARAHHNSLTHCSYRMPLVAEHTLFWFLLQSPQIYLVT